MQQPEITPALIKELRERTGVGMGKCKEALVAAQGDIEEAILYLRKAGMVSAVKKEGRTTNEGMIASARAAATIAIVEANAETDFVVRNDKFQSFLQDVVAAAAKKHTATLEALLQQPYPAEPSLTIDQYRTTLVQALGEHIQIKRVHLFDLTATQSIGLYSHMGGKLFTAVVIEGSDAEEALAKDIAMHAAAAAPQYLDVGDVPQEILAHERDVAASQLQGKPAAMIDKIVDGKLNAFYEGACLLRQKYIRDDAMTVQQVVDARAKAAGKALRLVAFLRWTVGS